MHENARAELTVLPVEAAGVLDGRLAWKVQSSTAAPRGEWVSFVDALTGELLNVHNEVRFLTGEVHAEHDVRTPNGEMMESPMRWMRIQGDGETTYTDEDGVWALDGEDAPAGDLVGQYVRIRNEGGPNADLEGLTEDVLLTADDADQAELSAFVFQSQIRQWATVYAPEIPLTDTRINVYVNIDDTCNAYFDGSINFMRSGGGCRNTGRIADVNYHEWGHGFHYYSLLSGEFDGSMSEGIADAVSMLNTGDPIIAPGFFNSGYAIRELETNRVYPDDIVNEVHTDGLIFGGAVWDLVNVLAEEMEEDEAYDKVSRLLAAAVKSGPTIPEAFDAFIVADDDNGDLSDGTPNSCAIIEAFSQHGLGPGGGGGALVVLDHTRRRQPSPRRTSRSSSPGSTSRRSASTSPSRMLRSPTAPTAASPGIRSRSAERWRASAGSFPPRLRVPWCRTTSPSMRRGSPRRRPARRRDQSLHPVRWRTDRGLLRGLRGL